MQSYRSPALRVHRSHPHLALVGAFAARDEDTTAADIAREHNVSRATVYRLHDRVLRALEHNKPGPAPGAAALPRAQQRIDALEAQLRQARGDLNEARARLDRAVDVTKRRAAQLELVLTVENVSHRGIQRVFDVAFDGQRRPSLGALNARLRAAGRAAQRLLTTAREQVRKRLDCVLGDDIFFAGTPVKVVAEPRSVAILNVGRWRWHEADDWSLWLEEFTALRLFVSDLGTDLVGAVDRRGLTHQADYFHEMQWWEQQVFRPLAKVDEDARATLQRYAARVVGTPSARERRELDALRAHATRCEDEFFLAYAAVEELRALFSPMDRDGTLWTNARVDAAWDRIEKHLLAIKHPAGERACRHVTRHGHRFTTHRALLDAIEVQLVAGTRWTAHGVRQGVLEAQRLEARAAAPGTSCDEAVQLARRARTLRRALGRACSNVSAVEQALRAHLACPPRSSSSVESLNSQLRVLQMVHRTVSDELLSLSALAWNLTPRTEGRRKGRSPYEMLGVDLAQAERPWYDVLLDAIAA